MKDVVPTSSIFFTAGLNSPKVQHGYSSAFVICSLGRNKHNIY